MMNLLLSKLDHQRLTERIVRSKTDPTLSRNQMTTLFQKVNEAALFEPTDIPANVVTMNSRVTIEYVNSRKTVDIQLVYPEETNIQQNRISIFAPMATAILGRRENEQVGLNTPNGTVKIRIARILYQPEAAGDLSL
ncbi:GreA/GreB family elongation factor [Spirosoma fluminis]